MTTESSGASPKNDNWLLNMLNITLHFPSSGSTNMSVQPNCSDFGLPECEPEILYVIPMAIITIAIILGNVLILLIFYRIYKKTCLPVGYLANLAIADLGVGVCNAFFCLPLVIQGRWPFNHVYSDAIGFAINTFSAVSATTLGVVSIDRYLYVSKAIRYHSIMTKRVKIMIIVVLWLISASIGLPGLFGVVHFYYDEHAYLSYIHFTDSLILTLVYVVGILLPVIITMIVCYSKIYVIARRHIRDMKERGIEQKSSIHVVTTLVLTVLCFVLCWTPYAIHHFTKALTKLDFGIRWLDFSVTWLAGANSCANCIIYWLRQTEVRNEVRSLLCCREVKNKDMSETSAFIAIVNGGPIVSARNSSLSVTFGGFPTRKCSNGTAADYKPVAVITSYDQENELHLHSEL